MPISGRYNVISADAAWENRRVNFRVESGKTSAPFHGEAEEVDIGAMFRGGKLRKTGGITETQIIRPELVPWAFEIRHEMFADRLRTARSSGKGRGADDAEYRIVSNGAGSPAGGLGLRKKAEGGVMMGMILQHESDEEIRVQKGDHGRWC